MLSFNFTKTSNFAFFNNFATTQQQKSKKINVKCVFFKYLSEYLFGIIRVLLLFAECQCLDEIAEHLDIATTHRHHIFLGKRRGKRKGRREGRRGKGRKEREEEKTEEKGKKGQKRTEKNRKGQQQPNEQINKRAKESKNSKNNQMSK